MSPARLPTRRSLPRGARPRGCRGPLLGGLRLRWRTRWREDHLDAQLAGGADPVESDELSLRTGQLGSAETRDRLAAALETAVARADRPAPPRASKRRDEIRVCRTLLLDLARCVRHAALSDVQGLAITALLVDDAASPLHTSRSAQSLASAAYSALFALEPQQSPG